MPTNTRRKKATKKASPSPTKKENATKKASQRTNHNTMASQRRWGSVTRNSLREIGSTLEAYANTFVESARTCELFGFAEDEDIRIDGAQKLDRALTLLEEFIGKVHTGVARHQQATRKRSR